MIFEHRGRSLRALIVAFVAALVVTSVYFADDRFTVCSVTINADDEIRTFASTPPLRSFASSS